MLFASVAPEVSTTSRASHDASFATASRAFSTCALAARPKAWTLAGFAQASVAAATMASTTSGASGVVAFQSR